MKTIVALAAIINSVSAAPAILWAGESSNPTAHSSDVIELNTVVRRALSNSSPEPSLKSAIFVLSRDADGNDGLTSHSTAGNLPTIGSLYGSANSIEHHVRGLTNIEAVSRSTQLATDPAHSVVETTLDEFNSYSKSDAVESAMVASDGSTVNNRALSSANVVIVHVDSKVDSKDIDATVSSAIRNKDIGSVILTTYRSSSEAQLERNLQHRANKKRSSRRLEDEENNENNNAQDSDYSGVYFVNFTPNIFAGLMFGFFFIMVTYVGIMSLNNISGQGDIYVTKYPHIGREH